MNVPEEQKSEELLDLLPDDSSDLNMTDSLDLSGILELISDGTEKEAVSEEPAPVSEPVEEDAPIAEDTPSEETSASAEPKTEEAPEESLPDVDFSTDSLEAILAEFSDHPAAPADAEEETPAQDSEEPAAEEPAPTEEVPSEPESAAEVPAESTTEEVPTESSDLNEFDSVPSDEEFVPNPIVFQPPSRLKQLRKQLVIGPEHRYYELSEIGVGKLQLAIIIMFVCFLLTTFATMFYSYGEVPGTRIRFLIFSQVLGLIISAIFSCYLILEGIGDIFKGRFTTNTMLSITLIACCVDAFFCLDTLSLPFGAVFTLETTMALWAAYERRNTEMGEMDTMRKAVRLDGITLNPDYQDGKPAFLLREAEVEEFMSTYNVRSTPEHVQGVFNLIAFLLCIGVGVMGYFFHDMEYAIRMFAASMLCAMPATTFICLTRPMSILERRFHKLGTVLCGWQGVKGLRKAAVFPLSDTDLFPIGSVKLNGVKFFGSRNPDQVIGFAAAMAECQQSSLLPIFRQLRESRNCKEYSVSDFTVYDNGGIGGILNEEAVLMGSREFMAEMKVELPTGNPVENAIYMSVDHKLCAVFALTYTPNKSSARGLNTLCSYRKLNPIAIGADFIAGPQLLTKKYKIRLKRMSFAPMTQRAALRQKKAAPESPALALVSRDNLSAKAFAVTGARCLSKGMKVGLAVHMIAGAIGILCMAAIAVLGRWELLTPAHILLYHLVWAIPGLLITEWTRSV